MLVLMILSLLFVFVENVFWDNNYYLFCYGVWRIFLFFFHKEIIFLNVFEKLWSWWFFVSCLFLWKNFWKMFSRIIIIICFVIGFGEFLSSFFIRKKFFQTGMEYVGLDDSLLVVMLLRSISLPCFTIWSWIAASFICFNDKFSEGIFQTF